MAPNSTLTFIGRCFASREVIWLAPRFVAIECRKEEVATRKELRAVGKEAAFSKLIWNAQKSVAKRDKSCVFRALLSALRCFSKCKQFERKSQKLLVCCNGERVQI